MIPGWPIIQPVALHLTATSETWRYVAVPSTARRSSISSHGFLSSQVFFGLKPFFSPSVVLPFLLERFLCFLMNSMFIGFSSFSACSLRFFYVFLDCLRLWLIFACLLAKFLAFFPVAINPCQAFFVDQWRMQLSLHVFKFISCFCDVPYFLFDFQDTCFHLILFGFACP